jgi:hypothetical protein
MIGAKKTPRMVAKATKAESAVNGSTAMENRLASLDL